MQIMLTEEFLQALKTCGHPLEVTWLLGGVRQPHLTFEYRKEQGVIVQLAYDDPEFPDGWTDGDGQLLSQYQTPGGLLDLNLLSPAEREHWDTRVEEMNHTYTEEAFRDFFEEVKVWEVHNLDRDLMGVPPCRPF